MAHAAGQTEGRRGWWWLIVCALLAFAFWGTRPLWEPDEGRYGEAARAMAVSGDWLVPRLQGQPHLTKPPLAYWLSAAGLRASGVGPDQPIGNAWGGRFYVALAFFGTMLCVAGLGATWGWGGRASAWSALIFGTALVPFACGHILSTDMLLTFWETLAVLCAWRVWGGRNRAGAWRWGFWIALGMAFLTKGPPGWLPLLSLAAFVRLRRGERLPRLWSWGGLAFVALLSFGWFVAVEARLPGSQWRYFLGDEVLDRVFTGEHERGKPFWFYFLLVPLGMTPWLHLWAPLVRGLWRRIHPEGGFGGISARMTQVWLRIRQLDDPALFSLLWFTLPMGVFLLATSKMYLYVTPLMAPIALWMGRLHARECPDGLPVQPVARGAMLAIGGVWAAAMLIFLAAPESLPASRSYRILAWRIRALPSAADGAIHVDGGVLPHSLSFYSGMKLVERPEGITTRPFLDGLADAARTGPVYLLTEDEGIEDLRKRGFAWREWARQRGWRVVEVLPGGIQP